MSLEDLRSLRQCWQWRYLGDLRLLTWVAGIMLIVLTENYCAPYYSVQETSDVIRFVSSPDAYRVPGILFGCCVLGLGLAWSKRSALNGAYGFFCFVLGAGLAVYLLHRALFLIEITPQAVTVHNGIGFWGSGSLQRHELARVDKAEYRVRGNVGHYPLLVGHDGQKVHISRQYLVETHAIAALNERWQLGLPDTVIYQQCGS